MSFWTYTEEGEKGTVAHLSQQAKPQRCRQQEHPTPLYVSLIIVMCQERAQHRPSSFLALLYSQYLMFHNWLHAICTSCSYKALQTDFGCKGSKIRNAQATSAIQWIHLARQKQRISALEINLSGTTVVLWTLGLKRMRLWFQFSF